MCEVIGLVSTSANTGVCTGARDGAMATVEVLAGPERRRRWSIEQKQAIVAAAFEPGTVVRGVARQADVTSSLIYRWRRDLRAAANGFLITDYPQPSQLSADHEHSIVSAGLNDGTEQSPVSKRPQ